MFYITPLAPSLGSWLWGNSLLLWRLPKSSTPTDIFRWVLNHWKNLDDWLSQWEKDVWRQRSLHFPRVQSDPLVIFNWLIFDWWLKKSRTLDYWSPACFSQFIFLVSIMSTFVKGPRKPAPKTRHQTRKSPIYFSSPVKLIVPDICHPCPIYHLPADLFESSEPIYHLPSDLLLT